VQQGFGALEEDLDLPTHPENPDAVLGGQRQIGRKNGKPFFLL
jgi:hypothetical protein